MPVTQTRQQKVAQGKANAAAIGKKTSQPGYAPTSTAKPSGFAPGARPDVYVQNKGQVTKNGKLVVDYGYSPEAIEKAKSMVDPNNASGYMARGNGVIGDKGGETFRQLNTVDRGAQTGKANLAGIGASMASRGFKALMDPEGKRIIGGISKSDYGKSMNPSPVETPEQVMERIRKQNANLGPMMEQKALTESLKSGAEGGANSGVPNGSDVPGMLATDPSFKKLLEESIATRTYGSPAAKAAADLTKTPTATTDTLTSPPPDTTTPTDTATTTDPNMTEGDSTLTMAGGLDANTAALLKKFGLSADGTSLATTPAATATTGDTTTPAAGADTTSIDNEIAQLAEQQYDPAAADTAYNQTLESIKQKYDQERAAASAAAESQFQSRNANLAQVGFNPLSSGGNALDNEKQVLLQKFMSDIGSRESADKMDAANSRSTARTTAVSERLKYLQDKRANAVTAEQTTYDRKRNETKDALDNINKVLTAAETGQRLNNNERDNAVSSMKTMFDNFGSTAFDALNPGDLRKFEKALSLPAGSLRTAISSFKTAEKAKNEKPPELREVGGSLYQMTYDSATQTYVPKILIKKASTGSGSPGSGVVKLANGGTVSSAVSDAALRDYYEAYADSGKGLEAITASDRSNIVSQWMMLGAGMSGNPFTAARTAADSQFGSSSSSTIDELSAAIDAASGTTTK